MPTGVSAYSSSGSTPNSSVNWAPLTMVWRNAAWTGSIAFSMICNQLYGSPEISGPECTFDRRPRFDNRQPYKAGGGEAQATAQSERTRPWLLANLFQAISQASMMSARLENTELASQ